jgi:uncharacterized membrane protein
MSFSSAIIISTLLIPQGALTFLFSKSTVFRKPERYSRGRNKKLVPFSTVLSTTWLPLYAFRDTQLALLPNGYSESTIQEDKEDDDMNNPFYNNPDIPHRQLIEVSSRIELPFSATVAYDAYADLPRQATWSSWLDSVVVQETNPNESIWTLRLWSGITYSWTAVMVRNHRPHVIQWKSISGLPNFGSVRFYSNRNDADTTLMTMKMTFVAPRAVSLMFYTSKTLAKYVEQKIITQSLEEFRNVVSKEVEANRIRHQEEIHRT